MLYVTSLNVSLFSAKQHMKYKECYEHSKHNSCTIAFPNTIINADIKEVAGETVEVEGIGIVTIRIPKYDMIYLLHPY